MEADCRSSDTTIEPDGDLPVSSPVPYSYRRCTVNHISAGEHSGSKLDANWLDLDGGDIVPGSFFSNAERSRIKR